MSCPELNVALFKYYVNNSNSQNNYITDWIIVNFGVRNPQIKSIQLFSSNIKICPKLDFKLRQLHKFLYEPNHNPGCNAFLELENGNFKKAFCITLVFNYYILIFQFFFLTLPPSYCRALQRFCKHLNVTFSLITVRFSSLS